MVYCDEDQIDDHANRSEWIFKPAWSPHVLHGWNYLGLHLLMRRDTVRALDGWTVSRSDPHHDLALRLTARVKPENIVHLAKLLFHRATVDPASAQPTGTRAATAPPTSSVT